MCKEKLECYFEDLEESLIEYKNAKESMEILESADSMASSIENFLDSYYFEKKNCENLSIWWKRISFEDVLSRTTEKENLHLYELFQKDKSKARELVIEIINEAEKQIEKEYNMKFEEIINKILENSFRKYCNQ